MCFINSSGKLAHDEVETVLISNFHPSSGVKTNHELRVLGQMDTGWDKATKTQASSISCSYVLSKQLISCLLNQWH